jgi:hypothetical protein
MAAEVEVEEEEEVGEPVATEATAEAKRVASVRKSLTCCALEFAAVAVEEGDVVDAVDVEVAKVEAGDDTAVGRAVPVAALE